MVETAICTAYTYFGAAPPVTKVPPHPLTIAVTPPPINSLPTRIGWTFCVQTNGTVTRTTQTLKKAGCY